MSGVDQKNLEKAIAVSSKAEKDPSFAQRQPRNVTIARQLLGREALRKIDMARLIGESVRTRSGDVMQLGDFLLDDDCRVHALEPVIAVVSAEDGYDPKIEAAKETLRQAIPTYAGR